MIENFSPVEAESWEGPAFQTCVNASNVSKRFESNRRRLNLSFKHHAEITALSPTEADALLDWCEETKPPLYCRRGGGGSPVWLATFRLMSKGIAKFCRELAECFARERLPERFQAGFVIAAGDIISAVGGKR